MHYVDVAFVARVEEVLVNYKYVICMLQLTANYKSLYLYILVQLTLLATGSRLCLVLDFGFPKGVYPGSRELGSGFP